MLFIFLIDCIKLIYCIGIIIHTEIDIRKSGHLLNTNNCSLLSSPVPAAAVRCQHGVHQSVRQRAVSI